MIYLLSLITVLAICLFFESRNLGYKCSSYHDYAPSKDSSITDNLSKIHCLSKYVFNTNYVPRYYITALIIATLLSIYYLDVSERTLFYTTFIVFTVLLFSSNFYHYHHDRFPCYYIQKNARFLSQQLSTKIKREVKALPKTNSVPVTHLEINAYDAIYNVSKM